MFRSKRDIVRVVRRGAVASPSTTTVTAAAAVNKHVAPLSVRSVSASPRHDDASAPSRRRRSRRRDHHRQRHRRYDDAVVIAVTVERNSRRRRHILRSRLLLLLVLLLLLLRLVLHIVRLSRVHVLLSHVPVHVHVDIVIISSYCHHVLVPVIMS